MEKQLNMEMLFLEPLVNTLHERGGRNVQATQEGFLEAVLEKRNLKPFQFGTTEKGSCFLKQEVGKALKTLVQQGKVIIESKGVWSLAEKPTQKPLYFWLQEDSSLLENFKRFSVCYETANISKKACHECFFFSDCQERKAIKDKEVPVEEKTEKKTIKKETLVRVKNASGNTMMCGSCSATIGKDETYFQSLENLDDRICQKCEVG